MTIDPEKLEEALRCAVNALECARRDTGAASLHSDWLRPIIAAARAHLATLPRYKEVEVWHVEYALPLGNGKWVPTVLSHDSEHKANSNATCLEGRGAACIRVTGPHKYRVPA